MKQFFKSICRPSTDKKKVGIDKHDGATEQVHYRNTGLAELHQKFMEEYDCPICLNTFSSFVPTWIRRRSRLSGLCSTCYRIYSFAMQLRDFRRIWHVDCDCNCVLCIQCNHGFGISFECHLGTCLVCCADGVHVCPIEFNTQVINYKETSFRDATGKKSGNRPFIQTINSNRHDFSEVFEGERQHFLPHYEHLKFHKANMKLLEKSHDPTILQIRLDFIENLKITTFNTIQSQHFAEKQVALLVFSVSWYVTYYTYFLF